MDKLVRLAEAISAVCPIYGVQATSPVTIDYALDATTEQQEAAAAVLAAFDWTNEAHATWERQKRRDAAVALLNSKEPTMVAVRALATIVKRRMSTLLTALGQTPLTTPQLIGLWADCIADGEVDETIPPNGS